MNVEKIMELAEYIRTTPEPVKLFTWSRCIVGHAHLLWPETIQSCFKDGALADVLGITDAQREKLVYPDDAKAAYLGQMGHREASVAMLLKLADTGEVNWG